MRRPVWWFFADDHSSAASARLTIRRCLTSAATCVVVALALAGILGSRAMAATVTGVDARHHDGQTFVTWDNRPGTGWTYRVYSLEHEPDANFSPSFAHFHGSVGDSSGLHRRLSVLLGSPQMFRTDSASAPLDSTRGLMVVSVASHSTRWYVVTADSANSSDTSLVAGKNVLSSGVEESPGRIRPVWQRSLTAPAGEAYVLWAADHDTPDMPALANSPSRPLLMGVRRGQPGAPLIVNGHGRGGSFLNSLSGAGFAGESIIAPDDHLDTEDQASWYFGYHEDYDESGGPNLPPLGGTIVDYGERRVRALLDWSRDELGHDRNRVYALGASMGGTFAVFMAWHYPDLFAAATALVPKISFARSADELFYTRFSYDRLWGSVDLSLPCTNGRRTYEWLDPLRLARLDPARGAAPIQGFVGRNDDFTGWAEKVAYLHLADSLRLGGVFHWDNRVHAGSGTAAWLPAHDPSYLHRFELNRSYPAFSHCSAASNLGNGNRTDGDSVGTLNAMADFDVPPLDVAAGWQIVLRTRALTTRWGTTPAPESLSVDVTPRRLQQFAPQPWAGYSWRVVRVSDGAVIQSGWTATDQWGLLTIPQVKVMRLGSRLEIGDPTTDAPRRPGPVAPRVRMPGEPLRAGVAFGVEWPGTGPARVDLFDAGGRRAAVLFAGEPESSSQTLWLPRDVAPGIYWVRATRGAASASARAVILR